VNQLAHTHLVRQPLPPLRGFPADQWHLNSADNAANRSTAQSSTAQHAGVLLDGLHQRSACFFTYIDTSRLAAFGIFCHLTPCFVICLRWFSVNQLMKFAAADVRYPQPPSLYAPGAPAGRHDVHGHGARQECTVMVCAAVHRSSSNVNKQTESEPRTLCFCKHKQSNPPPITCVAAFRLLPDPP
jgi:hypothetical protein